MTSPNFRPASRAEADAEFWRIVERIEAGEPGYARQPSQPVQSNHSTEQPRVQAAG